MPIKKLKTDVHVIVFRGIKYNILVPPLSYLGLHQDEEKKRFLQRDKYFLELGTKPKKMIKRWSTFICKHWDFLNI